jgi:hypothetical protein
MNKFELRDYYYSSNDGLNHYRLIDYVGNWSKYRYYNGSTFESGASVEQLEPDIINHELIMVFYE